jgi:hypothetical protein
MRRSVLVRSLAAGSFLAAVLVPATANADGIYHSAHITLLPTGGTVGGSGVVENAHANGPQIYAHEQYQLRGAAPLTAYQVTLHIYVDDPTCAPAAGLPVDLNSAVLTTNTAGYAAGNHVFTPADAAGLPKLVPHGIVWTMSAGPGHTYTSGCEVVVLD